MVGDGHRALCGIHRSAGAELLQMDIPHHLVIREVGEECNRGSAVESVFVERWCCNGTSNRVPILTPVVRDHCGIEVVRNGVIGKKSLKILISVSGGNLDYNFAAFGNCQVPQVPF